MTCIVGLQYKGHVYIAGDSAGVSGYSLTVRGDSKVFHNVNNPDFIFGFTSSFRMGQILRYRFVPPPNTFDWDTERYVTTDFVDEVRKCLKEYGFSHDKNGPEEGGTFLFGYNGRLFTIYDDYQIEWPIEPYNAVGCGAELAIGAMFATYNQVGLIPNTYLELALKATVQHNGGVRGPFNYVSTADRTTREDN